MGIKEKSIMNSDKFNSLISLIENINMNKPFKDILDYIYDSFSAYIPYTYIGIALIEDDGETIKASFGASGKNHKNLPKRLLGYKTNIYDTSLIKIVQTGKERIINDLEDYTKGKSIKEYNKILLEEGIRSSITFPLKNNKKVIGIIFFSSNRKNIYKKEHIDFLKIIANSIALGLEKTIFIDDMIIGSVQALAKLAEQRDRNTGEHLKRISVYSRLLAKLLSKNKKYSDIINIDYIDNIERFSTLHDIGKVGIRDDILLKAGRLTPEEFSIMQAHTIYGSWVLKTAEKKVQKNGRSIFSMGIEIAEGHHEKWDGSGYPYGKAGEDIPLSARIVAVADVFDALTSKRSYKDAFSYEYSRNIIISESGKSFDPDIAGLFIEYDDEIRKVYERFKSQII
ncbi:MAG: HD domain-containing phosphohydrolase [Clostridiales bacterium]|nr:HD domain-containing phosphohydrolase [Clostridiales bacterium]